MSILTGHVVIFDDRAYLLANRRQSGLTRHWRDITAQISMAQIPCLRALPVPRNHAEFRAVGRIIYEAMSDAAPVFAASVKLTEQRFTR